MAEENKENKKLPATPRRRQKAREKGQVARSKEVTATVAMAGIVMVLYFGGASFFHGLTDLTAKLMGNGFGMEPLTVLKVSTYKAMLLLMPVFGAAVVFAAAGSFMQGGFVLKPPELKFDKFNLVKGIKNKFSINALNEFLKSLLKFSTGIVIFFLLLKWLVPGLPDLVGLEINVATEAAKKYLFIMFGSAMLWLILIAIVSYILEKRKFEKELKMTREEVKEERKETEGDPQIKSRIRSIQFQQARQRMMQEVPKATVIITNPTHLAAALLYEDNEMPAPRLVAKGSGFVAEKIKKMAAEHDIPLVEDRPVARMLFKLEIGSYVPPELYKAVARVLSYIYKLKGKAARGR